MADTNTALSPIEGPATAAAATERVRLPGDQYLVNASALLADQLVYRPATRVTSNDWDQAMKALMILQGVDPPLTPRTLSSLLIDLSHRSSARDELFRPHKHSGLGATSLGWAGLRRRWLPKPASTETRRLFLREWSLVSWQKRAEGVLQGQLKPWHSDSETRSASTGQSVFGAGA